MAEVYWIHLETHTDMFSEGYIGFTSQSAKERFASHRKDATYSTKPKSVIQKAILKYGDKLVVDTVCVCDNDYGLWLEKQLRPSARIGWNIVEGGGSPPNHTGRKRTPEQLAAQSLRMKESGVKPSLTAEVLAKISKTRKDNGHWGNHSVNGCMEMWKVADIIYALKNKFPTISVRDICRLGGFEYNLKVNHILGYIRKGFVPLDSELWLRDFTCNNLSFVDVLTESDLIQQQPWDYNRANKFLWASAKAVYEMVQQGCSGYYVEKFYTLPSKAASTLVQKIKAGWNPLDDENWLAFKASYEKEQHGA